MTHKTLAMAALAIFLCAPPVACGAPLQGNVQENGEQDPWTRLAALKKPEHTPAYYVEYRLIKNPQTPGATDLPYYPAIDKQNVPAAAAWNEFYQRICWKVLANFDELYPDECDVVVNLFVTKDGKITAQPMHPSKRDRDAKTGDATTESVDEKNVQCAFRAVELLKRDEPLTFPAGTSRERVWLQVRLIKRLGPVKLTPDPNMLFSGVTEHAAT